MYNRINFVNKYNSTFISIFNTIAKLIFIALGVTIIFFGTYGTSYQGNVFTGTIYGKETLISLFVIVFILFATDLLKNSTLYIYGLHKPESILILAILLLIFVSTFRVPKYFPSSCFMISLTVLIFLFVANGSKSVNKFIGLFAYYQTVIYTTSVLAVATGIYSMHVGPISIGPLVIEYNPIFWRMNSWVTSSTMLGILLCHGVYSGYYFYYKSKSIMQKCLHLLIICGIIYGILMAGGRTGVIVCGMAIVYLVLFRTRFTVIKIIISSIFIYLAFHLILNIIHSYAYLFLVFRRFSSPNMLEFGGRSSMFEHALLSISNASFDELIFGFGVNSVKETLGWLYGAHSGMIRIFLEYGLFAYAFYIILNIVMLFKLAKNIKNL